MTIICVIKGDATYYTRVSGESIWLYGLIGSSNGNTLTVTGNGITIKSIYIAVNRVPRYKLDVTIGSDNTLVTADSNVYTINGSSFSITNNPNDPIFMPSASCRISYVYIIYSLN